MKQRHLLSNASSWALALTIGAISNAAAQQGGPAESEADVVITGSFIRGAPEDAAIPVRAMTLQEITNLGSPSNLDLVKNMVDSGTVQGEGDRRGAGANIGAQSINLRQLGNDRTVVLLNGRRLQDQVIVGIRFANTAVIPNNAVGRVDTLRDGGAVTYGSDAIGGVVNFITRHDFNGVQARTNYRFIEGSDGDYDADLLWGAAREGANIMIAAQYQHRSTLDLRQRDWAIKDYLQNNAALAWTPTGSPGSYAFLTARSAASGQLSLLSGVLPASLPALAPGEYARQMGSQGLFRDPACSTALGAWPGWTATNQPVCYFSLAQIDKLVEEINTISSYAEFNFEFPAGLRSHGEFVYYNMQAPDVINTPSEGTASTPVVYRTCASPGFLVGGIASASCLSTGQVVTFAQAGFEVSGLNPAVTELVNDFRSSNGNLLLSPAQQSAIQSASGGVLLAAWRPYGIQGNPFTGRNEVSRNRVDQFRVTEELSSDLPSIFGTDLKWTADFTAIHTTGQIEGRDILVDRMQAALNGFGGANCNGIRADLVGSTCQWFNPFGSGIPGNVYTGAANPDFVGTGTFAGYPAGGLRNSYAIGEWLHAPIKYERNSTSLEVNFKVDGDTPIELPGGPIAVAVGGQYRYSKDNFTLDRLSDQASYGCTTGVNCPWTNGPLLGNRPGGIFGTRQEEFRYYPTWAAFGQVQLPILDGLTADLAVRYEKFVSDTTTNNNSVVAPQGSVRWQVTDWLALRGVAGSTFANVNAWPADRPATFSVTNVAGAFGLGGTGTVYNTVSAGNFRVAPERGFNYNIGAIFKSGPLSLNVDYYSIKIDNLARTMTAANVLAALVQPGQPQTSAALINCSSSVLSALPSPAPGQNPFTQIDGLPLVTLNSNYDTFAECSADPTPTLAEAFGTGVGITPATVRFFPNPRNIQGGELETNGIDVQAALTFEDVLGGRLVATLDATKVLNYDFSDFTFNGATFASGYDATGNYNLSSSKLAAAAGNPRLIFEHRAGLGFNYTVGRHNFNWRTQYTSAIATDIATTLTSDATAATNANIPNVGTNVVDSTAPGCAATPSLKSGPDTVIPGAGQGVYGTLNGGAIGLCTANNVSITGGSNGLPESYNSDFTYRVTLPWDTAITATVQNVFDRDPSFERVTASYNSYLESPLGRTYRIGLQKKF